MTATPRRRKIAPGHIAVGVCLGIGVVAAGAGLYLRHQSQAAEAAAWAPSGPPCPTETKAAYLAADTPASHVFVYDDVHYARAYGLVACNEVVDRTGHSLGKIAVCNFNSPTHLVVTTKAGEFHYATGSKPASVTLAGDTPICVQAAGAGLD